MCKHEASQVKFRPFPRPRERGGRACLGRQGGLPAPQAWPPSERGPPLGAGPAIREGGGGVAGFHMALGTPSAPRRPGGGREAGSSAFPLLSTTSTSLGGRWWVGEAWKPGFWDRRAACDLRGPCALGGCLRPRPEPCLCLPGRFLAQDPRPQGRAAGRLWVGGGVGLGRQVRREEGLRAGGFPAGEGDRPGNVAVRAGGDPE